MRFKLAALLATLLALTLAVPGSVAGAALIAEGPAAPAAAPSGQPSAPSGGAPDRAPDRAPDVTVVANPSAAAWGGQYSIYRAGSFSVQKTNFYCVPASVQMMLNIIKGQRDHSWSNQTTYWRYAQNHSRYAVRDNGADPAGWAAALRHWGGGNYSVGVAPSRQAALRQAAKRLRLTGKPVGLTVWGNGGGHAWVMTGFRSNADPKFTDEFSVSHVQAMGPLYPHGTINGRSFDPGPREWVGMGELRKKFTTYRVRNSPAWNGRWVTVLP